MALPNKLFEYIQARLAIAIGPSPEMAKVVREYDCGLVSSDFKPETLADCLNAIDREKIMHYKNNSDIAARKTSYEIISGELLKLVQQLLEK